MSRTSRGGRSPPCGQGHSELASRLDASAQYSTGKGTGDMPTSDTKIANQETKPRIKATSDGGKTGDGAPQPASETPHKQPSRSGWSERSMPQTANVNSTRSAVLTPNVNGNRSLVGGNDQNTLQVHIHVHLGGEGSGAVGPQLMEQIEQQLQRKQQLHRIMQVGKKEEDQQTTEERQQRHSSPVARITWPTACPELVQEDGSLPTIMECSEVSVSRAVAGGSVALSLGYGDYTIAGGDVPNSVASISYSNSTITNSAAEGCLPHNERSFTSALVRHGELRADVGMAGGRYGVSHTIRRNSHRRTVRLEKPTARNDNSILTIVVIIVVCAALVTVTAFMTHMIAGMKE